MEQLEAFLMVAKMKSFTRAAELLHIVQPTVTARIKLLEKHLGKTLFKRDSKHVQLTTAGQSFMPYALRIMALKQEGERVIQIQYAYEDQLVVGSVHSLWDYVLFPVVNDFRELHPLISLRLVTDHSHELIGKILDGIVDVGVVYIPPLHHDMVVIPLNKDSFQLVGNVDFQLESGNPLTNKDLHSLSYVHHDWGPPFIDWYQQEFQDFHLSSVEVDHISLLIQFMLTCNSIGFLPETIARQFTCSRKIKVIPFQAEYPMPDRLIYLVYPKRKELNNSVQRFVSQLLTYSFKTPCESN